MNLPPVPGTQPAGLPTYYWSWTGTDPYHSLNLAYTSGLASWPAPIVTLNELGFGGPVIGYSTKMGFGQHNDVMILLAWTGTDPAHHLNVAVIEIGGGTP